jgi:hypothetical protein
LKSCPNEGCVENVILKKIQNKTSNLNVFFKSDGYLPEIGGVREEG